MVIWITGLPGSGKTTIAQQLQHQLQKKSITPVLLDGDKLREVLANQSYDSSSRKKLALTYAKLANLLSSQGHIVIVATVSLFHCIHEWNKKNNANYLEVFIKPCPQTLQERDQKGLYSSSCNSLGDRVGIQVSPEYPLSPNLTINNNKEQDLHENVKLLLDVIINRTNDASLKD
jgi:adenylylsulfate kinase